MPQKKYFYESGSSTLGDKYSVDFLLPSDAYNKGHLPEEVATYTEAQLCRIRTKVVKEFNKLFPSIPLQRIEVEKEDPSNIGVMKSRHGWICQPNGLHILLELDGNSCDPRHAHKILEGLLYKSIHED